MSETFQVDHLDLRLIAESGQVFRWVPVRCPDATSYEVESGGHRAIFSQQGSALAIDADDVAYFRHYLGLDENYAKMYAALGEVPGMGAIVEFGDGIRIVNQDWFEAAVTFIVSQNNNIPRIKGIVQRLCARTPGSETAFPSASALAQLLACDDCGLGYRLSYLKDFAERVAQGWRPQADSYAAARVELQELSGVGPKVADCICLYGLGFLEAHPVDVWIERALSELAVAWHPTYGGLQQQLLYYWMREHA